MNIIPLILALIIGIFAPQEAVESVPINDATPFILLSLVLVIGVLSLITNPQEP